MKNNENSKGFQFVFQLKLVDDSDLITKIRNHKNLGFDSQADLLREAIKFYFENDGRKDTIKDEMEQEKLRKVKKENIKLDLENRIKLIRDLGKSPQEALEIANGTKTIDEGAIYCPDGCNWFTDTTESVNSQINSLVGHMKIHHKRALTEKESEKYTEMLI